MNRSSSRSSSTSSTMNRSRSRRQGTRSSKDATGRRVKRHNGGRMADVWRPKGESRTVAGRMPDGCRTAGARMADGKQTDGAGRTDTDRRPGARREGTTHANAELARVASSADAGSSRPDERKMTTTRREQARNAVRPLEVANTAVRHWRASRSSEGCEQSGRRRSNAVPEQHQG